MIFQQASTLTFYADPNFTGASYSLPLSATTNENILPITKTDIEAHGLLNGISSVKLTCGTRAANVTLFDSWNTGTSLASWSPSGNSTFLGCSAFQVDQINLVDEAPELADRVASAYFVNHATAASLQPFSGVMRSNWIAALNSLPSGATKDGDPVIQLTGASTFTLRQNLELDGDSLISGTFCGARPGQFVLTGWLNQADRTFTVSVTSVYVDTGWGDSLGCRDKMKKALKSGASAAGKKLDTSLELLASIVGTHPRYYFYPGASLADFDIAGGGDDTTPVLDPNP